MQISFLSAFYPYRGGLAQLSASLYRAFETDGHKVKAYTFLRQYPNLLFPGKSQYVQVTDKVDAVPAERVLDSINPITYITTANKIAANKSDFVLLRYWMPFFAPAIGTIARRLAKKTKVLILIDNFIPHERIIGDTLLNQYALSAAHGYLVMSESVQNEVSYAFPNKKCLFIKHPMYDHFGEKLDYTETREKLGIKPDQKALLFFGFIRDYKGLDLALKALAMLPNEYILIIAGETYGSFDKYQDIIDSEGIANRIILHNRYISDEEVPQYFSAADLCVLPYKSATQSGVTAVSFHFNMPVIATDVGGLKETVKAGETGLLVAKPDPKLIADAIKDFFEKYTSAQFQTGIAHYKQELTWPKMARTVTEFSQTL